MLSIIKYRSLFLLKVSLQVVLARREKLAQLLRAHRYMPVAELCQRLDISEATARRDLRALVSERKVTRTHGGALGDFEAKFASFRERAGRAHGAKVRIAQTAASKVRRGSTIFLDAGTTLMELARQLAATPVVPLVVVTNNVPIAESLGSVPGMEVFLLGGRFLHRQAVLLGDRARSSLRQWTFDAVFLGAQGMTSEGVWNSQADVVRFQRAVLARGRSGFYCLDSSKIGVAAPHFLSAWKEVPHLVTDATTRQLADEGIRLSKRQWIHAS